MAKIRLVSKAILLFSALHFISSTLQDSTRTFRCLNTPEEDLDIKISTYAVNNGYNDCVSNHDEDNPGVDRFGVIWDDNGVQSVAASGLSCAPDIDQSPFASHFPDPRFLCPGDYRQEDYGVLKSCDLLCDGGLQCRGGQDEDVCFNDFICAATILLPAVPPAETSGSDMTPRKCEQYCREEGFHWFSVTPGASLDTCKCYLEADPIPPHTAWWECSEPCGYGNGFIPCGSLANGRSLAGLVRWDMPVTESEGCGFGSGEQLCVSPLTPALITFTCPDLEANYMRDDDQTLYRALGSVTLGQGAPTECFISEDSHSASGHNVEVIVPPLAGGFILARVDFTAHVSTLHHGYFTQMAFCPQKAFQLEVIGHDFQPTGLDTDIRLRVVGGEQMTVLLMTDHQGQIAGPFPVADNLNLVDTIGSCSCESSSSKHDFLAAEEAADYKFVLPKPLEYAGYVYAMQACFDFKPDINKKDVGEDKIRITKAIPLCPTAGYQYCPETALCHPEASPCQEGDSLAELPVFEKQKGQKNYNLERYMEDCGCTTVIGGEPSTGYLRVEAGEVIVVEMTTVQSAKKQYIVGDPSAGGHLVLLDSNMGSVRRESGTLHLQVFVYREHFIDVSVPSSVPNDGPALVKSFIHYPSDYGCACEGLENEKTVQMQTAPQFIGIGEVAGKLLSPSKAIIGPVLSKSISIDAVGTDLKFNFSSLSSELTFVNEEGVLTGDNRFEIDCNCPAEEGQCAREVLVAIENDLISQYGVTEELNLLCDHCNLPSLGLDLQLRPTGADKDQSVPVPESLGRDEDVVILFQPDQTCPTFHKCHNTEAAWFVNGERQVGVATSELAFKTIERAPHQHMHIQVCQQYCKYSDATFETQVEQTEACGEVQFLVTPSKCILSTPMPTSIAVSRASEVSFIATDPDGFESSCDDCRITARMKPFFGSATTESVRSNFMHLDAPVEYGLRVGEAIGVDYCCSDDQPGRPEACGEVAISVVAPGTPIVRLEESEDLARCAVDCDEFAEFSVRLVCDNCEEEAMDLADPGVSVSWSIKRSGEECTDTSPDFPYRWRLNMLSSDKFKFHTTNICSIFEQQQTGVCLCSELNLGWRYHFVSGSACKRFERNHGPVIDLDKLARFNQTPVAAECDPVIASSLVRFDSDLSVDTQLPVVYNVLLNGAPQSAEDKATPTFELFLQPGEYSYTVRAKDSCNVTSEATVVIRCLREMKQKELGNTMNALKQAGTQSKEEQSKAMSQISSAAQYCDADSTKAATSVILSARVEDEDSIAQVTLVAGSLKAEVMDDEALRTMGASMGRVAGNTRRLAGKAKQHANRDAARVLSSSMVAGAAADRFRRGANESAAVCGSNSQSQDLGAILRGALTSLSSSALCGLEPGLQSPTISVPNPQRPVFEMNCFRSLNGSISPDSNVTIPLLPDECGGDACALCLVKYTGCTDAMPAANSPDSSKMDIKLMRIGAEDEGGDCSIEILGIHNLSVHHAIEFSNQNLDPQPVPMANATLSPDKSYLAVDVEIGTENSAIIADICVNTSSLAVRELVVRGRHNFTNLDWPALLESEQEDGVVDTEDFYFVVDPVNLNASTDDVRIDGVGWIPSDVQDTCLDSRDSDVKCFRIFYSGFSLDNKTGNWSILTQANFTDDSPHVSQDLDIVIYSTTCLTYDEENAVYSPYGTSPSPSTSCMEIKCKTTHLSSFGGEFFVPPNSLDVMDSIKMLTNLNDNPVVFITLCVVIGIYVFVVIWCRRKDRADEKKLGITFLADNDPNDQYKYELTVYTGIGGDAGTTSHVTVILVGENGVSKPHVLYDENKELFSSGSVDTFILTTPRSLGELTSLQIWHNNSGNRPSWYLKHVLIKDMMEGKKQFIFLNNRWLAVDKDDGQVDREIPVATEDELKDFAQLFKSKIERDVWDGHIWFSVFGRPVRSNFSRVQRGSCCLCLLLCTMLANIAFFGAAAADTNTISVMGVELSWTQVMIGLECNVVIFPINFLVVYLFKNAKPRVPKELKENPPPPLSSRSAHHRSRKSTRSFTNLGASSTSSIHSAGRMTVSHTSVYQSARSSRKPSGVLGKIKALFSKAKYDEDKLKSSMDKSTCSIESTLNEPPPDQLEQQGKKPKGLPWWAVIIAWVLMATVSAFCAFFTLLYGMSYGKDMSLLWLKTFLMGFFQSLFFIQPIKIMCIGLFFALLIKKPEQPDPKEQQRMEIIEHTSERGKSLLELDYTEYKQQYRKLQQAYSKPSGVDLEAAKKYREKMKKMWDALFEIGRYFIFLMLLSTIVNAQTDPFAYNMTENIRNTFTEGTKWPKITHYGHYWDWLEKSLVPGLYDQSWYNGNETKDIRGFTNDHQNYLVGAARMRQVRMDPLAVCKIPKVFRDSFNDCYGDYSLGDGDTLGYLAGWKTPNETIRPSTYYEDERGKIIRPVGSDPWVYVPQLQADGIPIVGDMNMYGPGGYILTLDTDLEQALEDVQELKALSWIDTLTRAVIVEFTVFNPNVNLFSVVSLVVEFSAQGDGYPFVQMKTLRLYPYMSSAGYLVLVAQLAYMVFLVYYMWCEAKQLKALKWGYFGQFWNWVDLIIFALSWTSFVMQISYVVGVEVTMNQIKEFGDTRFISFGGPAAVNETYKIVSAATCFFGYVKLLHMLRFNKKMSSFASVLKFAAKDISNFLIMFMVVFFAFAQFAYLILGSVVYSYKSFVTTSTTLMAMLLGQWDFYEVEQADRMLGPVFIFAYIISATLILLNVFLAIICEACDEVNSDVAKQENDFEVVDFMMGQLKMLIGTSRLTQNAHKALEEEQEQDEEEEKNKPVDMDAVMCDFDSALNYISGHYCGSSDEEDEEFDRMLDEAGTAAQLGDHESDDDSQHNFNY